MRPIWKRDWFWYVLVPEVFMGVLFLIAFLAWVL